MAIQAGVSDSVDRYNELSPGVRRALDWLLRVSGAEEPTLSEMEEAIRVMASGDRRKLFEIAMDSWRDEGKA